MVKLIHISDIHLPCLGDKRYNSSQSEYIFKEFEEQIRRLCISVADIK
jgi:hypothetical protein